MGGRPLVRSLATVSCFGDRQRFFRGELIATLRILQSGDMPPEDLAGSWAGAFGHTQFMPSTFQRLAVDFDGDGRRDIVGSVPDALGSTANFLKRAGWASGEPWGYEVRLPANYNGPSGRRTRQRSGAMEPARDPASRRRGAHGQRPGRAAAARRRGRSGVHRVQELRRDLFLQRRRILRARDRAPFRPAARRRPVPDGVAHGRSRPVARRAARAPAAAHRARLTISAQPTA